MKNKTYIYHNDPGHGWLAVKRKELAILGIADQITNFSYQKGQTVYLEEDGDAGLFFQAYEAKFGKKPQTKDSYVDTSHPIRSYQSYDPHRAPLTASDFNPGDLVSVGTQNYRIVRKRSKTTCIIESLENPIQYRANFNQLHKLTVYDPAIKIKD